jgi:DNA-directed RNA polymerase subunit M/transcription elongation factor TFIIS
MSQITTETEAPRSFRVDRHCPRCRAHRYHWAKWQAELKLWFCRCAECGHKWKTRLTRLELDLEED